MDARMFASGSVRRFQYLFLGLFFSIFAAQYAQAAPVLVSVDHRVTVSYSKPQFDTRKGIFTTQVRIKNRSDASLLSPMQLSFDQATLKNFRIQNAQGVGKDGRPYFVIKLPKGRLLPKASSEAINIVVAFDKRTVAKNVGGVLASRLLNAAQHVSAGVEVVILGLSATPDVMAVRSGKQLIRFSVPLLVSSDNTRAPTVYLRRKGDKQLFAMNDLGKDGDFIAADGIYGVAAEVDASRLKPDGCLRYEAILQSDRSQSTTSALDLCVSDFPLGIADSNLNSVVTFPGGTRAVADELLVTAKPQIGSARIRELANSVNGKVVGTILPLNFYQIRLGAPLDSGNLLELVGRLKKIPEVANASVNAIGQGALNINDTSFDLAPANVNSQHGLKLVLAHNQADETNAWDAGAVGAGVTVVVMDTGLQTSHSDLNAGWTCQSGSMPVAFIPCTDTAVGPTAAGHGTQVAGVIAASTNNGLGIAGAAYGASVHAIKMNNFTTAGMVAGFQAAAGYVGMNGNAKVINASFNVLDAFSDMDALCGAIESVVSTAGVPRAIVVNAAGNQGLNGYSYPARCKDSNPLLLSTDLLITVSNSASFVHASCGSVAVNQRCAAAVPADPNQNGSNFGTWVDIAAPGSAIRTTTIGNTYASVTGTSFSTPFVSSAVAMFSSCGMPLGQIRSAIRSSANVNIPFPAYNALPAGSTPRLNIRRALSYQAPTSIDLTNNAIVESNAPGALIGTLSTTDPDACDVFTYSLVAGVGSTHNGSFAIAGNNLTINNPADFETLSSYTIRVRSTDFGGLTRDQQFTVAVVNQNEAPTAVVLSNAVPSTPENGVSVKVADISVTDDALGTNELSLAGADATSFSIVGNALHFNGGANFEAKSTYNVTVQVNDAAVGGNPDASQGFTLNISNVNEPPVVGNQVFTVNEGSSSGFVLGSVVASDPDTGASLTYSITGPNPGDFDIGASNGQVALGAVAMDFEATPVYTFTVQVSDGTLSSTATITVNVTNINEPPTALSFANVVAATPENGVNVKVADISITDDALGTNVLSVPAGPFSIAGSALYFNGGADFETLPAYSVVVSVDDVAVGVTPDVSQTFNLAITDVNEAPSVLVLANTVASTPENGGNMKVADIVVTDDVLGTNVLSVNSPSFSIAGSELHFNGGADFETLASYPVTVSVDDVSVGVTPDASQSFTLTITDVNEAATAVLFSNVVSSIPENGGDIKVADIAITDDALGVNTLLLSGTDPGSFSLVGNELHFNGAADFEIKSAYSVTVEVNDPAVGGAVDASQTLNLAITNVNEPPVILNQTFNHNEYWSGTPFDPNIGIVAANDPDAGDTLTFTITADNEATVANGVVQSNAFAFTNPAGTLVANNTAALNFEYKPVFNLGVQVTDAGGLSSNAVVTVNLTDDATDNGDPHINTVDRLHYDFQSAGEFVALRGKNGMEIQVRQTPVSTATPLTDPLSGLTSGVSVNTALAMRVGKKIVTYQAENGAPVLRVEGAVTTLPADGIDLGDGGHVMPQGGGIKVDFPDGTTLLATASPWAYYNVWWVNFSVHHTTAREGIMGARKNGSWLPRLSNGSAFGAMPAAMHDRYVELYVKFADSWRVTDQTSLFHYADGTSTATYTNKAWPTENGPYVADGKPPVKALPRKEAQLACRGVLGKIEQADCVFDVMVMGHKAIAKGHLLNQKLRLGATEVQLRGLDVLTKRREKVFTATVKRVAAAPLLERKARLAPTGSVQFMLEGKPLGKPVKLDAKGQARIVLPVLKLGKQTVTARFIPTRGSVLLPSISRQATRLLKPVDPILIRGIR